MDNDELLKQVMIERVRGPFRDKSVFRFLNIKKFEVKEFRIKFLKISSGILMAVVMLVFFAGLGKNQAVKIENTSNAKSNNETVNKVTQLIVLPEESPIIAVIAKVELLKNNLFFAGAKKGDKVLLFTKADKAILYDSLANKIINVGTVVETGIKP